MVRRSRFLRIIGISALTLIVALLIVGFIAWRRWHTTPGYWHITPKGNAAAAARSERFENWIVRELYTVCERGNPDASDSTSTWSIRLDADSINQWLAERLPTWAANQGFKLPTWLKHPMVVMKHDRLIVAARVKRNGTSQIVSLVYRPVQPQTGPVVLALVEIRSGTLGLPAGWLMDAVLERVEPKQREKWRTQLQHIPLRLKLSDKRYVTVERMTVEDGSVTLRCRTTRK